MNFRCHLIIFMVGCRALSAQEPAASAAAQPVSAIELQRQAIAKMQQSIVLQKISVEKQAGSAVRSFFLLSPPETGSATAPQSAAAYADCEPMPSSEIDPIVTRAATAQGLDPDLLRSVIRQESAFRPCSVSRKGAMGLMQLMPPTVEQFAVRNPFEPIPNVEAGAKFLKRLLNRYNGDLAKALAAYNSGPATVDAAGGLPQIPETIDYVKRILSNLQGKKD